MTRRHQLYAVILLPLFLLLACNVLGITLGPAAAAETQSPSVAGIKSMPLSPSNTPLASAPQDTPKIKRTLKPRPKQIATDIPEEKATFSGTHPGDPGKVVAYMDDVSEKATPDASSVNGGDDYADNIYERPFNLDQTYRPDLDIQRASLSQDANWFYVVIQLAGVDPAAGKLSANYGVELDVNEDSRGEYVVWALPSYSSQWKRINTKIYGTSTHMVGGPHPVLSDALNWSGDTYDKVLFDGLTDSTHDDVWVRISPKDPASIEIAFSPKAVGNATEFLWSAWADDGIKDPTQFDYNDQYTKVEAGGSFINDPEYPPKAIFAIDNTCRMWVDSAPSENIPGICALMPKPTPEPTKTKPPIKIKLK